MKTKIKTAALVALLLGVAATAQNEKTIAGFGHVESVASDGKYVYAADIGKALSASEKDGDGKIFRLDWKGNVVDSSFAKTVLNAPKGLALSGGLLFTADVDRVVAIDVKTGQLVYAIDFGNESVFLNDIAVDGKTLYVTATDKNKIFKVDLVAKTFSELKTDVSIAGPNGLWLDKKTKRLYVNGFGSEGKPNGVVGYIDLARNTFTRLGAIEGYFDGMWLGGGKLYVSDWVAFEKKGVIRAIDLKTGQVCEAGIQETFSGPADFTVAHGMFIVPQMLDGTIRFTRIKK